VANDPTGSPGPIHPPTPGLTPKRRSGPGPATQGHFKAKSLARTDAPPPNKETDAVHIVRQDGSGARITALRARRSRRLPIASASLYEPAAGRTQWWLSIRCPHCGSVHLGRVRTETEAPGPRRAGCGRLVLVVVRRTYRGHAAKRAAA
jgi:hypothetical protein